MRLWVRLTRSEPVTSDSERELFGGSLLYDAGFIDYEYARLGPSIASLSRSVPRLVGRTVRLVWDADRRALLVVGAAELGQGVAKAVSLLVVNGIMR
jgi:ATP-binding cassette, subfamily B, bacterial